MDYEHEVVRWLAKHNTIPEVRWAFVQANACITTLTVPHGINDPYELAVWQARLPLLKAKALLLGVSME